MTGCFTKFGVEIAEADKPEPYLNVSYRPLYGLFGQILVQSLVIHYTINYNLNITSLPQNTSSPCPIHLKHPQNPTIMLEKLAASIEYEDQSWEVLCRFVHSWEASANIFSARISLISLVIFTYFCFFNLFKTLPSI